jgi:hypothetical protein
VAVCENLHPSLTGHTRHARHTARQTQTQRSQPYNTTLPGPCLAYARFVAVCRCGVDVAIASIQSQRSYAAHLVRFNLIDAETQLRYVYGVVQDN